MVAFPIGGHNQIMPKEPPLRQLFAGVASGCHSSPGLKIRGFLAGFFLKQEENAGIMMTRSKQKSQ
jgi:hypothetical protein